MVKKTSFLDKLKNRWRPASGIQVDDRGVGAPSKDAAATPANRVSALAPTPSEAVSSRKLSSKQEAVVAINEGFKELASLLRGMQTRVDDQGEQIHSAVENIGQLPALNQAQIDLMRVMAERMERQNDVTEELSKNLGDMPELVQQVKESLDQAAQTDERTAKTLDEFRSNMSRVQDAMSQIVDYSGKQAQATSSLAVEQRDMQEQQTESVKGMVAEIERANKATLTGLKESSEATAKSLRRSQSDQADRMTKMVESNKRSQTTIIWLLGATVVALVTIAIILAAN